MQTGISMKKNRTTLVDILLLIIVTIIIYLPVSTFLLSLKNDSLVQYLPYRYHVSESIQHGYFPFWSPYLYTGFPIHADMQGMTWNPIVLLISLCTRYNMSVLEFEVVMYLILAAIGMYGLLKSYSLNRIICLLGSISYVSCGFINGSASVIPWISSAAFIPFVLISLKKFLESPKLKNSLLLGTSLSLLFLCGYPTFFIYTTYIILAILLFAAILHFKDRSSPVNRKTIGLLLVAAIAFLCIGSPAIISYLEFLPDYSRGAGITVAKAAENPFTPFSSISFIVPNAVNKNHAWLETDPSMRNSYVGLFVFLLFCLSFTGKYNRWQRLILGITFFSFLLSLGSLTPVHKLSYQLLPLFDTFRHPGNIRLFTSIGIILLAAFYAQKLLQLPRDPVRKKIIRLSYTAVAMLGLVAVYVLTMPGVLQNIGAAFQHIKEPKAFLDGFYFDSFLLIQCVAQIVFIIVLIYLVKKETLNKKMVAGLIAFNSIFFGWIALPFTFVSQIKTSTINQYVESFPDGYPLPGINTSVEAGIISDSTIISVYGYANFYTKKITIQDHIITPTLNKDYEVFCADKKLRSLLANYPLAWLNDTITEATPLSINKKFSVGYFTKKDPWKDSTTGSVELTAFSPAKFSFIVSTNQATILSIFQQYNRNWTVRINGLPTPILRMNIAFMGVAVPYGESIVEFSYKPTWVISAIFLSLSVIIIIALFFILTAIKSRRP